MFKKIIWKRALVRNLKGQVSWQNHFCYNVCRYMKHGGTVKNLRTMNKRISRFRLLHLKICSVVNIFMNIFWSKKKFWRLKHSTSMRFYLQNGSSNRSQILQFRYVVCIYIKNKVSFGRALYPVLQRCQSGTTWPIFATAPSLVQLVQFTAVQHRFPRQHLLPSQCCSKRCI